ncbi:uncharacterized protein EDB93DRAFT_718137 [Suillus bovinus]|uniref:uncharacterized protein n=1 Tax=Suillus bovinus TaxID=48563 RepID=UPI001B863251|nr:uncharacterized protein EDB93DRAFT_718137 [Suillus bovinus]KAG2138608.1 hypothetical protein EDB93DRAFT_718137 [Suillus bovinus]
MFLFGLMVSRIVCGAFDPCDSVIKTMNVNGQHTQRMRLYSNSVHDRMHSWTAHLLSRPADRFLACLGDQGS